MVEHKNTGFIFKWNNSHTGIKLVLSVIFITGFLLQSIMSLEADFHAKSMKSSDKIERTLTGSQEEFKKQSFLIYIIDFNDFMCMSCLNSFLEFYHILPPPFQSDRSVGILVDDHQYHQKNRSTSQKIMKKKLSGFIKANRIGFPIYIDSSESFKSLTAKGTKVIVFSGGLDSSKTYTFPLSSQEREEIFETLFQPE